MNIPNPFKRRGFTLLEILIVVAIVGLLAALAIPALADSTPYNLAPQQPNFYRTDTNSASYSLTNGQTLTFTAGSTNTLIIPVRQGVGMSAFLTVWQTNSSASTTTNYTVKWDTTPDGVTWTAGNGADPLAWTVGLGGAGASTNTYWTNWAASTLSNVRDLQATVVSTTASNNIFGKLTYSYSGQ